MDGDRLKTEQHCQTLKGILPEDLQLVGSPVRGFCGSLSYKESIAGGDVPKTCQSLVFPLSPGMPHLRSWWDLRPAPHYMCHLLWYQPLQRLRRLLFSISTQSFVFFLPCTSNRPPNPSINSIENDLFAASRQAPRHGHTGCTVFLLHRWSLPNPEYYTLRYADGPQLYITEQVSTGRSQTNTGLALE